MNRSAESYLAEARGCNTKAFEGVIKAAEAYARAIEGFSAEGRYFTAYYVATEAHGKTLLGRGPLNDCLDNCKNSVGIFSI